MTAMACISSIADKRWWLPLDTGLSLLPGYGGGVSAVDPLNG
jgi:hypothetical protein